MADSPVSTTEAVTSRPDVELHLLLEWPREHTRAEWLAIAAATLFIHAAALLAVFQIGSVVQTRIPEREVIIRRTPLYLPPDVLTQKARNLNKLSAKISLADLTPSQASQRQNASIGHTASRIPPPSAPKPSAPAAPVKTLSPPKELAKATPQPAPPKILPEAPKLALNQPPSPLPPVMQSNPVAPPPQAANAPPANPFQTVDTGPPPPGFKPKLTPPKSGLQAVVQGIASDPNRTRIAVNDDSQSQPPRLGAPGSIASPSGQHAQVELKSDPQGADFAPYLAQILTIVRGNWHRVTPESARLGKLRGETVVEFAINRDGSIPKLVVADPSGSEPLDRAAIAGLSMSNPLPPLPSDFKGMQVRLAFSFTYNLPNR